MFGYRLVRETDFDELKNERNTLVDERVKLLREMATLKATAASKAMMSDLLTTRVNILELDAAQIKHERTGLPATAPQIGRGNPIQNAMLAAGVDLFSDVGDEEAARLSADGMLHDQDPLEGLVAPAAELVPGG